MGGSLEEERKWVGYWEEVGRYTGRKLGERILGGSLAEEGTKEEVGRIGISKMSGGNGYDTGRNLEGYWE